MEIHELWNWLNIAPIDHNNFSAVLNIVDDCSSHLELAWREFVQNYKPNHIDVSAFLNFNKIVQWIFNIVLVNVG